MKRKRTHIYYANYLAFKKGFKKTAAYKAYCTELPSKEVLTKAYECYKAAVHKRSADWLNIPGPVVNCLMELVNQYDPQALAIDNFIKDFRALYSYLHFEVTEDIKDEVYQLMQLNIARAFQFDQLSDYLIANGLCDEVV